MRDRRCLIAPGGGLGFVVDVANCSKAGGRLLLGGAAVRTVRFDMSHFPAFETLWGVAPFPSFPAILPVPEAGVFRRSTGAASVVGACGIVDGGLTLGAGVVAIGLLLRGRR